MVESSAVRVEDAEAGLIGKVPLNLAQAQAQSSAKALVMRLGSVHANAHRVYDCTWSPFRPRDSLGRAKRRMLPECLLATCLEAGGRWPLEVLDPKVDPRRRVRAPNRLLETTLLLPVLLHSIPAEHAAVGGPLII
jgi:hypothetical protein